jgi:hypothetical protein
LCAFFRSLKNVHLKTERSIVDTVEREAANFGVERAVSLSAPTAGVHERAFDGLKRLGPGNVCKQFRPLPKKRCIVSQEQRVT